MQSKQIKPTCWDTATSDIEAEQQRLAALLEKKPILARVAASSFITAFELIRPERNPSRSRNPRKTGNPSPRN